MRIGILWLTVCSPLVLAGERTNHEGRALGPLLAVKAPLLFNTPEADAVLASMQIMPRDNPWNEDISKRPLLPNSEAMIACISADLAPNRRTLRLFTEMNFVLVPDNQPLVPVKFEDYPAESDLNGGTSPTGLYPIPQNLPVESWPVGTDTLTLGQWQQDSANRGGDRHAIIVQPGSGRFFETWQTKLTGNEWQASNGAIFSLNSNNLRPAGWTSGDAAGLTLFPALVRFDECQRGKVEHALRLVVKRTRLGPLYPATHAASVGRTSDADIPAMGQRLRLKASFVIPPGWSLQEKAVLLALKKHGAIVADNGGFFSVSITPDDRYPKGCFDHINSLGIGNFEVIQTSALMQAKPSPAANSRS